MIMPTYIGDIVISLHKMHGESDDSASVTSSLKTQGHLRKQHRQGKKPEATGTASSSTAPPGLSPPYPDQDPWLRHDPWGGWKNSGPAPMDDGTVQTMASTMEERLSTSIQKVHEDRFQKLEVDIAEIKLQSNRHEQWFQDAGSANQRLQTQVNHLATQVTLQQHEMSSLSHEIKSGFQNMEALLSKKQRGDE